VGEPVFLRLSGLTPFSFSFYFYFFLFLCAQARQRVQGPAIYRQADHVGLGYDRPLGARPGQARPGPQYRARRVPLRSRLRGSPHQDPSGQCAREPGQGARHGCRHQKALDRRLPSHAHRVYARDPVYEGVGRLVPLSELVSHAQADACENLQEINHENIVRLIAVVTTEDPILMVFENHANGSLKSYLTANRNSMTQLNIVFARSPTRPIEGTDHVSCVTAADDVGCGARHEFSFRQDGCPQGLGCSQLPRGG
jgi:hypothetical protein